MQNLLETFRSIGNLSPENEILLLNAIKKVEVPAKTILHEAGKICDSIYFVEKGIARTFYYKNGKDITYWIAPENEFVGAMASFF
jgi:CRP-like cAMP-binding protein